MNKMSKRISTCMAFVLMLTLFAAVIPANAQELDSISCSYLDKVDRTDMSTEISPMSALCPDCERGSVITTYGSWGKWYNVKEVTCTHYPWGTDMIQERKRTVTSTCNYCGTGMSRTAKQTRTVCHGYEK